MQHDDVYMDVPVVEAFSKAFKTIGDVLNAISITLQALLTMLRTTAFVGMFGGWALQAFLEQLKPKVDKLKDQVLEISDDLQAAVQAYQRADEPGNLRFH